MGFYADDLKIDDHILDKIVTKHRVSFDEVSEVCESTSAHVRRVKPFRYMVLGRTSGGRYLMVILVRSYGRFWKVATARDMAPHERRLYARTKQGRR